MTFTLSLWLSVLYVMCYHHQVTSALDVFLVKVVSSQVLCNRLCVYTSRCQAYHWDVANRTCHLSTQPASTDSGFTNVTSHKGQCGHCQCAQTETCVPVEGASAHICLKTTLPTSSLATTAATLTTTPSTTATATSTTTTADTTTTPTTTTTTKLPQSTATMPTTTHTTTTTTAPTTTTTPPTTTSTTTPSTSTVSSTPTTTVTTVVPGFIGCYKHILPVDSRGGDLERARMTIDMCRNNCAQKPSSFFGLQARTRCFCLNNMWSNYPKVADNECNITCPGDKTKMCGGDWEMAIYQV
ncbi:mucin-6-like isoform X2 [Haliotis asinina]